MEKLQCQYSKFYLRKCPQQKVPSAKIIIPRFLLVAENFYANYPFAYKNFTALWIVKITSILQHKTQYIIYV